MGKATRMDVSVNRRAFIKGLGIAGVVGAMGANIPAFEAMASDAGVTVADKPDCGDVIRMGEYAGEPIEWRVLAHEDGRILVVSDKIIMGRCYNDVVVDAITWETCSLRTWLNSEFLSCFSDEEVDLILECELPNPDNAESGAPGGNATRDRVFLLSRDECDEYFAGEEERIAYFSYRSALEQRDWVAIHKDIFGLNPDSFDPHVLTANPGWWVLRSPGQGEYWVSGVMADGGYYDTGHCYHVCGIRPAMWLML